jgi:predicted O-methyltransferase YrrM
MTSLGPDTLADIGGGQGELLARILAAYPTLRGILFDQPDVVRSAGALLERAGVADRCEVVGGSFFETVPAGADAYLLKSVIHDWDEEAAIEILRTCRAAMDEHGKLLVVERVIRPGNDPDPAKFSDLNMLVIPGGSRAECRGLRAALCRGRVRSEQDHPHRIAVQHHRRHPCGVTRPEQHPRRTRALLPCYFTPRGVSSS